MPPLLRIDGVSAFYGPVAALKGVSLHVGEGEIVALIGANGAGKSTLMMTICASPPAQAGSIHFDGMDITQCATHEIARRGLSQVPEGRRIFAQMSVRENLQIGAATSASTPYAEGFARVASLFPWLTKRSEQRAGTLSGGEQQMLAIARALMSRPRLLLLDEPSLGLAPLMAKQIFAVLKKLNREEGLTLFLVEQHAYHALRLAHRAYVLVNGEIGMEGAGAELLRHDDIRAAYLGGV